MKFRPEKKIEAYLVSEVKKIGGKCIKMIPTYENGIPDRQVLYNGRSIFIELKKAGADPTALQVAYMQELKKHGFQTRVIDNKAQVDALIADLLHEKTD